MEVIAYQTYLTTKLTAVDIIPRWTIFVYELCLHFRIFYIYISTYKPIVVSSFIDRDGPESMMLPGQKKATINKLQTAQWYIGSRKNPNA